MCPINQLDPEPAPDGAGTLIEIATAVRERRPPTPAAAAQFVAAVFAWLEGAEIGKAFRVAGAGRGHDSARTKLRRRLRDAELRCAFAMIDGPSPWRRALILAAEVDNFMAQIRPAWGHRGGPPPGASALRSALWRAARYWPLPTTARALHSICALPAKNNHDLAS